MAGSAEVDNTKAIALPILFIVSLLIAGFICRRTLATAYQSARCCCGEGEFRLGIMFWGGMTNALLSIFLFPTAGWAYGITSALFSYLFALSVGSMEKHANRLFVATAVWFAFLLGIPGQWSSGLITKVSTGCKLWFTSTDKQGDYCKEEWISFTIVVSIAVIISNFFILLVLMSFSFDIATNGKALAPKGNQSIQQPLNAQASDPSAPVATQ